MTDRLPVVALLATDAPPRDAANDRAAMKGVRTLPGVSVIRPMMASAATVKPSIAPSVLPLADTKS